MNSERQLTKAIFELAVAEARVFSRASRMLRGATQPVKMPCVCLSVCGNFFPNNPRPPQRQRRLELDAFGVLSPFKLNPDYAPGRETAFLSESRGGAKYLLHGLQRRRALKASSGTGRFQQSRRFTLAFRRLPSITISILYTNIRYLTRSSAPVSYTHLTLPTIYSV